MDLGPVSELLASIAQVIGASAAFLIAAQGLRKEKPKEAHNAVDKTLSKFGIKPGWIRGIVSKNGKEK